MNFPSGRSFDLMVADGQDVAAPNPRNAWPCLPRSCDAMRPVSPCWASVAAFEAVCDLDLEGRADEPKPRKQVAERSLPSYSQKARLRRNPMLCSPMQMDLVADTCAGRRTRSQPPEVI